MMELNIIRRMYTPPIGTPNIAPFQLDLRAQNYLPLVEIATLMI